MSRKSKSSETDLMLHMFADPTKLKPIEKTIQVSRIEEDETALENGPRSRKGNDDSSFEDSDSRSVSSSSSARRRNKPIIDTKSHSKLDEIVKKYNAKSSSGSSKSSSGSSKSSSESSGSSSDTSDESSSESSNRSNRSNRSSKSSNSHHKNATKPSEEVKKEPMYIPKWTNEREKKIYKMGLYYELQEYAKRRKLSRDYPPSSSIEDMEDEVKMQQKLDEKEEAIVMGKEAMKQISSLIVRGNNAWDPFGLKLDGWDAQIANSINNYDTVLSRLHDKYASYMTKIEPEYIFIWMFVGSAVTFHYTKKYVEDNGLEELVRLNPGLMEKIQNTIASTLETKVSAQLEPKKVEQKKQGLSQAETYRKYKEMQMLSGNGPIPEGDDENEKSISPNVNNTIDEMLVSKPTNNRINPASINNRINPPSLNNGQPGPMYFKKIMATANPNHTIPLSETSRVKVETVDSESVDNKITSGTRAVNRPRLKVVRN